MKAKRLLMLTMSILAVATLGSCRRGGRGGSSATSGGQDTSSTTGGHIIPSTTGGTTSSSSAHTNKSVIIDICKILFEENDPKSDVESPSDYCY